MRLSQTCYSQRRRPFMNKRVRHIVRFINKALATRSIEEIVTEAHLSLSRLNQLFKKALHITVQQYLKRKRIKAAKVLLETTFLTWQEIVVKVGAGDPSHFA